MFQHQGIWLPDGERHFPEWMTKHGEIVEGKGTYQIKKLRKAVNYCREFGVAVDVGAHVGLWSMQLAKRFAHVAAFEPVKEFRDCFYRNAWVRGVALYPYALGAAEGEIKIDYDPADSGNTHVDPDGDIIAQIKTLDSFALPAVDFLKIDCEGYEAAVLIGARETLARCKPIVIVEQKQHKLSANYGITGTPAVDYLCDLGARLIEEMSGDYIMGWR